MRRWLIAGIALTASTGPTLAQDSAAGEQVFRRLCSPCHDIGPDGKIKLGPPLNAIDGRNAGTFVEQAFDNIFARQCRRCLAPEWHSSGSRIKRTSQTFGPTSSNSGPKGRRNKPPGLDEALMARAPGQSDEGRRLCWYLCY
jgi:hypothetical protein